MNIRHIRAGLALTLLCIGSAGAQIEPRARQTLSDMVRAYRSLRSLDMQTTYTGDPGGFTKPVKSRLVMQRPNRLLYEVWQNSPGFGRSAVKRYVCDGRSYYVYDEMQAYYTKEKAPKDLKGLLISGAGLEFSALSGVDPFAGLDKQVRAARHEGLFEVNGEPVDVILLDTGSADRTGEARLYISCRSRMILRFAFESVPLKQPKSLPPLEPLNPDDPPEQELKLLPVRFGYDNKLTANQKIPDAVFAWNVPAGALLYEPLDQMLSRDRKDSRPTYEIVGKDGKRQKPLTYSDLVKKAREQKKKRR